MRRTLEIPSPAEGHSLSIQRTCNGTPDPRQILDVPCCDGFSVIVQLQDFASHRLWQAQRLTYKGGHAQGSMSIAYLGSELRCQHLAPYDNLRLNLPRAALDQLLREDGLSLGDGLDCPPGTHDPVTYHLSLALLPALETPSPSNRLFVDQLLLAMCLHVSSHYGGIARAPRSGGLSPWQLRRAKEMIAAHLGDGLSVAQLAEECLLSRSYFSRAFRQSTGMSPHEWLQKMRVEKARQLLQQSCLNLSQISLDCGFADQSHFSRVFSRLVGCTPSSWRRLHRGRG